MEAWLDRRLGSLMAPGEPYLAAVAAGTLGRLWAPSDPGTALDRLLQGHAHPPGCARAWAEGLPADARAHLLTAAFDDLGDCHDALDVLRSERVHDDPSELVEATWSRLVEARERLACIRWVLGGGSGAAVPELDPELVSLDDRAVAAWSEQPGREVAPWQAEVAASEPHAWWGAP